MPWGGAASGIAEGLTGGLQFLRQQRQQDYADARAHAQQLTTYMHAVDAVTKNPDALPAVQGMLRAYGMDLDPSILSNVEETRKAHGAIGRFLTSGDFETFSQDAQTLPQVSVLAAKSPALTKLVQTAMDRADMAAGYKELNRAALEQGIKPGDAGFADFVRQQRLQNPMRFRGHDFKDLIGPELTAEQSQQGKDRAAAATILDLHARGRMDDDTAFQELQRLPSGIGTAVIQHTPVLAQRLSAGREFGQVQGKEQALATPYETFIQGGRPPQNISTFAPPPGTPMPAGPGPSDLQWGPESFSLRSGPAMAMLGGQMDPVPPPRGTMAPVPPPVVAPVRGAPARGRTVGEVQQDRALELARTRAQDAADVRRENKDPNAPAAGTWVQVQTTDGRTMLMNSKTAEMREPSTPLKPKEQTAGTWVKEYAADGSVVLRNTKTNEIKAPDQPLAPRPLAPEKPKKYADTISVMTGAAEMPAQKPASPADAKDAEKAAAARADLMQTYQTKLNASLGDAGLAANSALRKAGWDPQTIRAAQGKTAKYLPQQPPTTTAGAPPAPSTERTPSIPSAAPDQGPQSPQRALRPPASPTPADAQAEYNRLRKAGHSPDSAKAAMRQLGW